ncbi:Zn ribbon nucleic-acid-binding protein [Thermocatellispora tengchongensis]|uniref:Zn ribbon nucleic-acid-binding protein n=1 Tax=Thermocatellispora tengchongensis TaxID=1073253 RepID=A0A840PRX6_9ACTN|nr:hypothetical protein [Thermocatellispora tengchongensis]MBB5139867.1 Zn ribbon nucleic-acid-binding protein [Thermocatellispora tengchongensis]
MNRRAYLLEGLHCASCGALDTLWVDPVWDLAECYECGARAYLLDSEEDAW